MFRVSAMPYKPTRAPQYPSMAECRAAFAELRVTMQISAEPAIVDELLASLWKQVFAYRPHEGSKWYRRSQHERRGMANELCSSLARAREILESHALDQDLLAAAITRQGRSPNELLSAISAIADIAADAARTLASIPSLPRNYFVLRLADHILRELRARGLERSYTKTFLAVVPLIGQPATAAMAASTLRSIKRIAEREGRPFPVPAPMISGRRRANPKP